MRVVIDSSSWISLARSGHLTLLGQIDIEAVLLESVRRECVQVGRREGYADAEALDAVMQRMQVVPGDGDIGNVDADVLRVSRQVGVLAANDMTLGRRARSLGVRWLRTEDLVVFGHRQGSLSVEQARGAIGSLRDAGRISTQLANEYLEEL